MPKKIKDTDPRKYLYDIIDTECVIAVIIDENYKIIYANKGAEKVSGYQKKELLNKNGIQCFIPKEYQKKILERIKRAYSGNLKEKTIAPLITKSGRLRTIFWNGAIKKTEDGKSVLALYGHDITEEIQTKKSLEKKEEIYRQLVENSFAIIYTKDLKGRYLSVNPAWKIFKGIDAKETINKTDYEIFNKKTADIFQNTDNKVIRTKKMYSSYDKFSIKGKDYYQETVKYPLRNEKGEIVGICGISHDVTEQVKAKKELKIFERTTASALRKSEEKYRTLFNNINIGVYRATFGKHGKFLDVNPALVRILGYRSKKELLSIRISDIYLNPNDRVKNSNEIKKIGIYNDDEIIYKKKDGTLIITSDSVKVVTNENGKPIYFDGIIEDITEQKKIQKQIKNYAKHLETMVLKRTHELEEQTKKALEATKIKSAFLASVSHELRTPLTSIIGYTELMEDDALKKINNKQKNHIKIIKKNAQQLLRLISDILDITKIENKGAKLKIEECNIRKLVTEIKKVFKPLFSKKGLELEIIIDQTVPGKIKTDHQKLRQILFNLISNALKFTPQGVVEILVYSKSKKIIFEISDTGIGISHKDKGRLFQVFQRTNNPLVQKTEGSGLGLVLTKKMVNLLNGKIEVKSKPEQGSTFIVSLPQ